MPGRPSAELPETPGVAFDPSSPALPSRLQSFLADAWHAPVELSAWKRFPGGMSWVTIGFTASVGNEERNLILRVGDPGGLFGPYRTEPEYLALTTLATIPDFPIPRALLRCDDLRVLGAPFVITARVEGDTPTPWNGAATRDESERESLAVAFSEVLGALHAFDWQSSPLAAWAEGLTLDNTGIRETHRWARECGYPYEPIPPAMHYALRWLETKAPIAERIVVVHGDYRVGNFLRQGGRITAILDWELVHLGDPHEDLAWAGLRAFSPGSTRVGGLVDRGEFYRLYSSRSGLAVDPAKLRYYEVLMQFKSAAMLLGALRRVQSGRTRDLRLAAMTFQLAPTMMEMLRLMERAA